MRMPFAWALACALMLLSCSSEAQTCAPAEVAGAKGDPIRIGSKGGGVYAFTFCRDDYSVRALYLYAPWSALTASVIDDIQAARGSVDAFRAQVAKVTGRQCEITRTDLTIDAAAWDTHEVLCTALRDAMWAVWPPDPVWRVIPLSTGDGSRPMYPVVNGVRQTTAVKTPRAPANARCPLTAANAMPQGTTANRWGPVEGLPVNLVTVCSRR